ncbi:hypothetical protein [Nocardioides dongkuii]|uniref:hypothetical protein n=1 Tax=Nocardioides dongkuii TaxID=2760089 RepID=UPI0015F8400C|nr:hypothetical protein [Nocardioides dongkuii]
MDTDADELVATFARLRELLVPFLATCRVKVDEPGSVYLETPAPEPEMFASIAARKSNVSFHYMPIYRDPALLDGVSPDLRRRMRGKSCFSFRRHDDPAIDELASLVGRTAGDFLERDEG